MTIAAFSTRLWDEVDLDTLSAELLAVVDHTMQPASASLWLRPPTDRARPLEGQGLLVRLGRLRPAVTVPPQDDDARLRRLAMTRGRGAVVAASAQVLPSTATARRGRRGTSDGRVGDGGGCWTASQAPMARSSASGSMRASRRRTVASPGDLTAPVRDDGASVPATRDGPAGWARQGRPG
jgi:hypothetical protein